MTNIAYHTVILNSMAPEMIRQAMVERYYSVNCNASAVAREYGTKRQTVTKWVRRFEKDGIIGLKDYPRTPHTEPIYKKPKDVEDMIITLVKKKKYRIGQDRVQLALPDTMHCSTATINRIMHVHNLIKKRRKKHQRKKQCAEYKKTLRALRNWQIDVKELRDIPNIVALVTAGIIPNFQYTARDQLTGAMFICYAWEHSLINSIRFVSTLFEHLKPFGIHPSEITIQTDNGSEFIGNIFAKEDSGFTSLIEQTYHAKHITIPIGKKEYQGVVESSHGRIEYELYDVETFCSLDMFLSKAYTYILYWNMDRKKIADKKSPLMLIKENCGIFETSIGDFKPFILDEVKTLAHHYRWQGVPYVGDEVKKTHFNLLLSIYI
ncbi:MAG: helix-turn-helix domain-containing protein [bacterium]|nr:helix-turn-helix domain-containing protein [bacterium]